LRAGLQHASAQTVAFGFLLVGDPLEVFLAQLGLSQLFGHAFVFLDRDLELRDSHVQRFFLLASLFGHFHQSE